MSWAATGVMCTNDRDLFYCRRLCVLFIAQDTGLLAGRNQPNEASTGSPSQTEVR